MDSVYVLNINNIVMAAVYSIFQHTGLRLDFIYIMRSKIALAPFFNIVATSNPLQFPHAMGKYLTTINGRSCLR